MWTLNQDAGFVGIEFLIEPPTVARHRRHVLSVGLPTQIRAGYESRVGVVWQLAERRPLS